MRAESKRIWLYMKPFHNMLSIKIVNTSDGGYRSDSENELLSTKAVSYTHLDVYKRQIVGFQKLPAQY